MILVSASPSFPDTVIESTPFSSGLIESELLFAITESISKPFSFKAVSTIVKSSRSFLLISTCLISYVPAEAYLFKVSLIDQFNESFLVA